MEASGPGSQHHNWAYFLKSPVAWVVGTVDKVEAQESGSTESVGEGMVVAHDGAVVHFRTVAPMVRITGGSGEVHHGSHMPGWRLW